MSTKNQSDQSQKPGLRYQEAMSLMTSEFEKVGIKAQPMPQTNQQIPDNTIEVTFFKKPKKT